MVRVNKQKIMNKYIEIPPKVKEKISQEALEVLVRCDQSLPSLTSNVIYWQSALVEEVKKVKATAYFREMELLEQIEQLKRQIR